MQIDKSTLENIIKDTVKATLAELNLGKEQPKSEKSAYQKTEILLYNYRGFQRVIREKQTQIEELRKYGVPHKGEAIHTYTGNGGNIRGLSTEDESVDSAVDDVEKSVREVQAAIDKINSGMVYLQSDPYYSILEMKYFDGMSVDDISKEFSCTPPNITYHKNRLVKELSLRLFPNDVIKEMLQ